MGLKQRLLQGQTGLSAGSFPGDTPINNPQSGFVQSNSPNLTYEDETLGQPNNGSALINTLDNTGLDNTIGLYDTNNPIPSINTDYPSLTKGEYGGASSQYSQIYGPNNTYLSNISIEDIDSPQLNTLNKTSLDNTNSASISNIPIPDNISAPNDYPQPVSGRFGSSPSQYESQYNANNPYLDIINTISIPANNNQVNTLDNTGLDNSNSNFDPTAFRPNELSVPTNYGNLPNSPSVQLGEYGGAPSQYVDQYTPNGTTYIEQIDSPNFVGVQSSSFSSSGLSTDTSNTAPTAFIVPLPDTITTYPPENVTGIIGGAAQQFSQLWGETKPYYNYMKTNFEAQ
jgi:hypothetical protein